MVDLSIAAVALLVLAVVVIAMARGSRRIPIGAGLAVIVLAAGTFGVMLYRSQTGRAGTPAPVARATQKFGGADIRVELPVGRGDKLPQGALGLNPIQPGPDAYTGDVSLLCSTPGKAETEQNCSGTDRRDWVAAPIGHRAQLAAATGDPFADPAACADVPYQDHYLELTAGKAVCARTAGQVVAIRIPAFPGERPLPVKIVVETTVVS